MGRKGNADRTSMQTLTMSVYSNDGAHYPPVCFSVAANIDGDSCYF